MITIYLGLEGEYGRRLVRYLERSLDQSFRLCHFTEAGQWDISGGAVDLAILSPSFYDRLGEEVREGLTKEKLLWITEGETGEGYCRYHPPRDLLGMIGARCGRSVAASSQPVSACSLTAFFSPLSGSGIRRLLETRLKDGNQQEGYFKDRSFRGRDLYLGMEDMGEGDDPSSAPDLSEKAGQEELAYDSKHKKNDMSDLCYYIHLKDSAICDRIRELSSNTEDYSYLPSPAFFLPLQELTDEDFCWFFESLKADGAYSRVYIGLGCGMLCGRKILSYVDRLVLVSSREDPRVQACCRLLSQMVQSGYEAFSGTCETIYKEDTGGL